MSTVEDVSQAPKLIGIVAGLCSFSCCVVALRVWVRLHLTRQGLGLDDAFILVALIINIATSIVICITTKYGLGRHVQYVDPKDIAQLFEVYEIPRAVQEQLAYTSIISYVSIMFAIKQSLLLFYLRLTTSKYFHKWCLGFIGLNTVLWLGFSLVGILQCQPISYFWDKSIPGGACMNLEAVYLANAAFSVFTDVAALLLPVKAVWNLTTSRSSKIQLGALLCSGFFICVASFVRMTTLFNFNTVTDPTWETVKSHVWSMIEVNIATVIVCAPTIKPAFTRYIWGRLLGIKSYNSSSGRSHKQSLPDSSSNPDSLGKSPANLPLPKKKNFATEEITTECFIEHEMANYGMGRFERSLDLESGHGVVVGATNSASTSTRDLAPGKAESDEGAEPEIELEIQQQSSRNPL